MQLRQSERRQVKIKMALQGVSGAGKTMSALLLAYGITQDWNKIAIVDSENGSADLYAHLGDYKVLSLIPPFSPERYIQAIQICEDEGIEVIILDSISHCWEYLLEYHSSLAGNSFTNWNKVTPRQKKFIQAILQSNCHIISTMRVKQDYVLTDKNGKLVPEKIGLKVNQRDGVDYEFTIVFDLDIKHNAKVSKDRTGLFMHQNSTLITIETGKTIKEWCDSGISLEDVKKLILNTTNMEDLTKLYNQHKYWYSYLESAFKEQKVKLKTDLLITQNISKNGITAS